MEASPCLALMHYSRKLNWRSCARAAEAARFWGLLRWDRGRKKTCIALYITLFGVVSRMDDSEASSSYQTVFLILELR